MPLSELPEVLLILVELLPFKDATTLAIASKSTLCNLEAANRILSSTGFKGMELIGWRKFRGGLFQQLRESIQPRTLIDVNCCECNALNGTVAIPLALETSGCYFVRFYFWCSSNKGCPSMGVVDAADLRKDPFRKLCEDASRPQQPSGTFGISCDPYTGKIHASALPICPSMNPSTLRSWSTEVVGWESCGDAAADPEGFSMGLGMLISNGTLEFMRQGSNAWESSGIVWDRLPATVVCGAFLYNFVGAAYVSLEQLLVNELPYCKQMKNTVCGKVSSWIAWEPEKA